MSSCGEAGKAAPASYQPLGVRKTIGGIQVYTTSGVDSEGLHKLLLLLPDGFGLAPHNVILADDFAKQGWEVIVPDYFEGDPLPIQVLTQDRRLSIDQQPWSEEDKQKLRDVDFPAWTKRHNHSRVSSLLNDLVVEIAKHYGDPLLVGVGYCFGGKHVLRLAKSALTAAAAFHPSFVEAEDLDGIKVPLYVGLAEKDDMVPASLPHDLRHWSSAGMREDAPLTLEIYPGMRHGFAARPDTKDENIRTQYQKAFERTVQHFAKFALAE